MTPLAHLAERVEAASGPDRMLDGEIMRALNPDRDWEQFEDTWCYRDPDDSVAFITPAHLTASLDAAMTLVPEGWDWSVGTLGNGAGGHSFLQSTSNRALNFDVDASTLALALTAASLRARARSA